MAHPWEWIGAKRMNWKLSRVVDPSPLRSEIALVGYRRPFGRRLAGGCPNLDFAEGWAVVKTCVPVLGPSILTVSARIGQNHARSGET